MMSVLSALGSEMADAFDDGLRSDLKKIALRLFTVSAIIQQLLLESEKTLYDDHMIEEVEREREVVMNKFVDMSHLQEQRSDIKDYMEEQVSKATCSCNCWAWLWRMWPGRQTHESEEGRQTQEKRHQLKTYLVEVLAVHNIRADVEGIAKSEHYIWAVAKMKNAGSDHFDFAKITADFNTELNTKLERRKEELEHNVQHDSRLHQNLKAKKSSRRRMLEPCGPQPNPDEPDLDENPHEPNLDEPDISQLAKFIHELDESDPLKLAFKAKKSFRRSMWEPCGPQPNPDEPDMDENPHELNLDKPVVSQLAKFIHELKESDLKLRLRQRKMQTLWQRKMQRTLTAVVKPCPACPHHPNNKMAMA